MLCCFNTMSPAPTTPQTATMLLVPAVNPPGAGMSCPCCCCCCLCCCNAAADALLSLLLLSLVLLLQQYASVGCLLPPIAPTSACVRQSSPLHAADTFLLFDLRHELSTKAGAQPSTAQLV